jgi:murein L,D-transpeptidase YafK
MHRVILVSLSTMLLVGLAACGRSKNEINPRHADRILILKSSHTLSLMRGNRTLQTYKVALGRDPVGPKTLRGDHKTPEGEYVVDSLKANSRFYRALHISYPNEADRERARNNGQDPGGDVEIHGIENGLGWIGGLHRTVDWTDGCIALTDPEMQQIWTSVGVGSPVEIRP